MCIRDSTGKTITLDVERDRLAGERLDEDLHAAAEPEHEVERRLLLDVVVREGPAVLELLAREDETLLIRWNSFSALFSGLEC